MCHPDYTAHATGNAGGELDLIVTANGALLPALFVRPSSEPAPAVLVIHDVWGANEFYRDFTRRLAGEGFLTLLPNFFVREGPLEAQSRDAAMVRRARMDQTVALTDIDLALVWLRSLPGGNGQVGVIGFCIGGTFAFLSASAEQPPDAAVAFYGFPAGHDGWPLRPIDAAAAVKAPVLGLWGDGDTGVGMDNVQAYGEALDRAAADYTSVIYPDVGHGFMTFDPASPSYEMAMDAWAQTIAFLRRWLVA